MLTASSCGREVEVRRYHTVDLVLAESTAEVPGNPFDVQFSATFKGPGGQALTIPGFYDTRMGFVVRFAPTCEGQWRYRSTCSVAALDGISGVICCLVNDNPNIHGPLAVDRQHPHHFSFEDGTHCFLMGYEVNWLMLVDQVPSSPERIDAFLDSITNAGFNMVSVNTYAHSHPSVPRELEADPRYATPKLAPWVGGNTNPDYGRMDAAFWAHFDRVMATLFERGLLVHMMIHVYNKSVLWPVLGTREDDRYWRYVLARYQAFCNIIWDPAKESYKLSWLEYVWDRIAFIRQLDGYRRILTVHDANWPVEKGSELKNAADPRRDLADALADFKSDQVPIRQPPSDWRGDAVANYEAAQRPYLSDEYGYEVGVESLPSNHPSRQSDWRDIARRSWLVTMGGGYINYYYCNTAWNLFLPFPEPLGYAAHRHYRDFWESTHYWRLAPDNAPLGEVERKGLCCRCDPSHEYVVMDDRGEGFTLTLTGTNGALQATWFNPLTGERIKAEPLASGTHACLSPWGAGTWAVLHVCE